MSVKNYENRLTYVKVISDDKAGLFCDTVYSVLTTLGFYGQPAVIVNTSIACYCCLGHVSGQRSSVVILAAKTEFLTAPNSKKVSTNKCDIDV